jgi:hypothetical protein
VGVVIPGAGLTVNNGLVDVSVLKYDSENNNIIGYTSIINGDRSVALGYNSTIYLNGYTLARNVVIGYNAVISCNDSVAIGPNSRGTGYNVVAIGYEAEASNGSVAIGFRANGNSENAVAIGYEAEASVFNSFAVGFRAIASGSESIQLGQGTNNIASTLQFLNQPVINSNMQLPLIIKGFNPLNSTAAPNLSVPITVANADSEPYWTIDATNQTGGTILDFTIMPNNSRLVMLVISGTAPAVFEFPTGSRQSGGGGNVYTGVANQTDRILVEKVNNTQYYLTVTRNYQ